MDDIEDMFGENKADKPVGTTGTSEPVKFNIWEDEPVPREFDIPSLQRGNKTFTIASFGKVPYDVLDKVGAFTKTITEKGYVLHTNGDIKDRLVNEAVDNAVKVDYYLAFKKINPNVEAVVTYPFKDAYDLSSNYAYKYENMKPGLKSFLAGTLHMLTGIMCNKPVDFILLYTECGKEDDVRLKYDEVGSHISTLLKYATLLNIPVYNVGSSDGFERLAKHVGATNE